MHQDGSTDQFETRTCLRAKQFSAKASNLLLSSGLFQHKLCQIALVKVWNTSAVSDVRGLTDVAADATTAIRVKTAANMLISRIRNLLPIPIQLTTYAVAVMTLTRIGIVGMSRSADFVSFVSR
jgi:hypothetical protein